MSNNEYKDLSVAAESSGEELVVDIEKIMEEIRLQIKEEYTVPDFEEIPVPGAHISTGCLVNKEDWETFTVSLRDASCSYYIPYYWELPSGGIKNLVKRIIRKLVKFLFEPILGRINHFHLLTVQCLNQTGFFIEGEKKRDGELTELVERQRLEIEALRKELDEQRLELNALIRELPELHHAEE